ncbi:MAG: ASKHA domain-containing protein [Candidatus Thorarchaeota archaeon]|nr:ASKHA domain-containing protein [Candidatus Thorarchaeota archaeon]
MSAIRDSSSSSKEYGLSVDIGTSMITCHLVNLRLGEVLIEGRAENPQQRVGPDIITRARHAMGSRSHLESLAEEVRKTIRSLMFDLLVSSGISQSEVSLVVVCGNTVMQRLFLSQSVASLLSPPYTINETSSRMENARDLGLGLSCDVFVPPIVRSFIGSDAIAVLLSAGVLEDHRPAITIDVGTNTEISVVTRDGIWMASAPSGPAFEGMSIACGMPAKDGAISSIKIGDAPCDRTWSVIGQSAPRGICGTGSISLLAELRRNELINEMGSFRRDLQIPCLEVVPPPIRYVVADARFTAMRRPIFLSQIDIRMLQQSKAAIRATIDMLLRASDLSASDIQQVYLTGAFGENLDIVDAYDIGLFPIFEQAQIRQEVGGAIRGADLLLMDHSLRARVDLIARQINYLELMDNPEFDEIMARAQIFSRF